MHYFETFEYLLRNGLNGLLGQRRAEIPGEIAFWEVFHCNIESFGGFEPS